MVLSRDWLAKELDAEGPWAPRADVLTDLTLDEVANAIGRAVSTVRTWCNSGRLPGAYRLNGRDWRVPRSALEALRNGKPGAVERAGRPADLAAWRREAGS